MNTIDPLKLQRLIDGELDTAQVQQILTAAKATPQHWEEIASGFVEDQIWKRSFQSSTETKTDTAQLQNSQQTSDRKTTSTIPISPSSSTNFSWLAIAATLLLASGIGYMAGQFQTPDVSNPSEVAVTPKENPTLKDSAPKHNLASTDSEDDQVGFTKADYHFQLPEDSEHPWNDVAGSPQSVPLYRVKNMEQYQRFNQKQESENSRSSELYQQLSDSGYQMEKNIEFISGRLGDGRSFIIPVETFRFDSGQ
jgi:hypothetical protein